MTLTGMKDQTRVQSEQLKENKKNTTMERKWYKQINGEWVEAPQQIELENGTLYNYNSDSNEEMLRRDGYVPENEMEVQDEII
jgi:hypothetical protein